MKRKSAGMRTPTRSLNQSLSRALLATSFALPQPRRPARAKSSVPILQTQSAESKNELVNTKTTYTALKARIQSLRAYKTALLQHHLARQSLLLTNETELMQLRLSPPRSGSRQQCTDLPTRLSAALHSLHETRIKHIREVTLYKRSAVDRSPCTGSVMQIVRTQGELYETQLETWSEEERQTLEKYALEVDRIEAEKTEIRRELEEEKKARMRELAAIGVLRRKEKMLEDALYLRSQHTFSNDTTHQSAQALLTNLKLRLSLPLTSPH